MNPILKQYEELLYFRLKNDNDLLIEDMIELLDSWYQLRRSIEDVGGGEGPAEGGGSGAAEKTQKAPAKPKPADKPAFYGPHAALKRETLEKLEKVRAAGLTTGCIVKAAGGALTLGELQQIIAREKVPIEVWQALAHTLEGLEAPRKEDP